MRDAVLRLLRALWHLLTVGDEPVHRPLRPGNALRELLSRGGRLLVEFGDESQDEEERPTLVLYEDGQEVRRHVGRLSDGRLLAFASPRKRLRR